MHKDEVANVKFNVAKTLGSMTSLLRVSFPPWFQFELNESRLIIDCLRTVRNLVKISKKNHGTVKSALESLSKDSDIDVSFFANEALEKMAKL